MAIVVGRSASDDGSVLLGHNEENEGQRVLSFRRVPSRTHGPGEVVRLRRGGTLEQAPRTAAFLWSENPGLESSDNYLNEHGVAIVSDGCASREDGYEALVARGEIRDGGIGYMLRRLVAERTRTAREGVELAGRLVERFGYAGSGRTYVIADPTEAWLVAVVRGRRWVARRVPDDSVAVLPNVFILGQVDLKDAKNVLASADLIEYAVSRGWFDPASGVAFDFRRAYQSPERNAVDPRQWRGQQLVAAKGTPAEGDLPCFVKPGRKLSVASVAAILRDNRGPRPLFHPATQEMAVFQLRAGMPAEIGCIYWRTTGRPDTSVLTPWYAGTTETPANYATGGSRDSRSPEDLANLLSLKRHFNPPQGTFDPDPKLAYWKFKTLQDEVDKDHADRIGLVRPIWAAFEERLFAAQKSVEAQALELWKKDPSAARAEVTRYGSLQAEAACEEADRLSERLRQAGAMRPHFQPPLREQPALSEPRAWSARPPG